MGTVVKYDTCVRNAAANCYSAVASFNCDTSLALRIIKGEYYNLGCGGGGGGSGGSGGSGPGGDTCTGDLVYMSCGPGCNRTCSNPTGICPTLTTAANYCGRPGCYCPTDKPFLDGTSGCTASCPQKCGGGMVYKECGPACNKTCDNPTGLCPSVADVAVGACTPGCSCPSVKPFWTGTECVAECGGGPSGPTCKPDRDSCMKDGAGAGCCSGLCRYATQLLCAENGKFFLRYITRALCLLLPVETGARGTHRSCLDIEFLVLHVFVFYLVCCTVREQ